MLKGVTGGLRSLHLLDKVIADGHPPVYTPLHLVAESLERTPSNSTITSLTGAICFVGPEAPPASGLECLECLEAVWGTTRFADASQVKALHKFRSAWLAKGAKELYHAGQTDNGDVRLVRRATRECPAPFDIHLPLIGKAEELAGIRSTLQFFVSSATLVNLHPYLLDQHATGARELYGLSFKNADKLHVWIPEGMTDFHVRQPLPIWITESAQFGAVKTLYLDHRRGPEGVSLYGGGVDKVMGRLPKLAKVGFMRRPITSTNGPPAVVPLMWAGLKHCAVEGGPLDVLVEVNLCARPAQSGFVVPIFHWQTVEEESDELDAVLKARCDGEECEWE
ncbi:unnamed protein product [Vitrella brassicaformis CCMP3155]|uniref:Uncharacterized protein n=1 Tax=Vitrella brassicaformis (strain CCMP3155) TaxID=1169540 RepID=A0A0G4H0G7_VITBC|nr:unnamed protein product [Vitrella brassicaformis CCMP3155]|eukprot:CEM37035.1 unnamed protein product [Vitrella brassicaformis CCMP3155]